MPMETTSVDRLVPTGGNMSRPLRAAHGSLHSAVRPVRAARAHVPSGRSSSLFHLVVVGQGNRSGGRGIRSGVDQDAGVVGRRLDTPVPRRAGTAGADVTALYRAHRVRLIRLAAAITLDRDLAEEIVQEAFAGFHRRRAGVENAEAYLQRSVVNGSIKACRRRRRANALPLLAAPVTSVPEIDETWTVVVALPPRQRAVVLLRFWADLSEAEMARVLGWRPGTVKSTLHRALRRLREELEP